VKVIIAGKASAGQWQQARDWLKLWRDNDARLQPILNNSELTAELVPVSHTLSQVATMGLQALDDLQNHHAVNEAALQDQMRVLKDAEKPEAVLLDMVVPSVKLLVQATGTH
jgi:hexosaminidase